MGVTSIRTPGLSDVTCVLTHDGVLVLVDPQRDADRFRAAIGNSEVRYVLEAHLHHELRLGRP